MRASKSPERTPQPSPLTTSAGGRPASTTSRSRPSGQQSPLSPTSTPNAVTRPSLQRQAASRQHDLVTSPRMATSESSASEQEDDTTQSSGSEETSGDDGDHDLTPQPKSPVPGRNDEAAIRKLREEMNAKLALSQQRARMSAGGTRANSGQSLGARRVSPIKEEPAYGMSPSLEAAFASPMTLATRTTSTESSTESGRTIRGSVPPTPLQAPLRTPSYPFPYVPGTPRTWSSSFHRPFTTLSPTVSSMNIMQDAQSQQSLGSEASTPAASAAMFMPANSSNKAKDDPQYPAPNLYELVLALSSEPGLESWWSSLSRVMYDCYGAERMSLAIPADAGELENVPWGQKATFSFAGPPEADVSLSSSSRSGDTRSEKSDIPPTRSLINTRPTLLARHSYAGPPTVGEPTSPATARLSRPQILQRTKSHAPHVKFAIDEEREEYDGASESSFPNPRAYAGSQDDRKFSSLSDVDFSTVTSEQQSGPYMEVLGILRALHHESHALLDTAGVNKILDRGKVVTLTRDYSSNPESRRESMTPSQDVHVTAARLSQVTKSQPDPSKKPPHEPAMTAALRHHLGADYSARTKTLRPYEEYEQFPSSPWAQSPAPSPAIQADEQRNPFFESGDVDEDSFNPIESSPTADYSKIDQVEAIGIDRASTVIHIPLIHPVLSRDLPPRSKIQPDGFADFRSPGNTPLETSATEPIRRKAPIAILSLLCHTVPYPQSLLNSLKLLAPHLATAFANAQQFTSMITQAVEGGRRLSMMPRLGFGLSDPSSLEQLMEADVDTSGSMSGSITSPSDYSGRSRTSPGGSIAGTPGWDPVGFGFARPSVGSTPGVIGPDVIDSYFDAKRRTPQRGTHTSSSPQPLEPAAKRQVSDESKSSTKGEARGGKREDKGAARHRQGSSPPAHKRKTPLAEPSGKKTHTLLHSYGADFASTFQSLPVAATLTGRVAGSSASSKPESEEPYGMPPPSERLLRTIIDSLPVQIFTAAPITGRLTWVNTKYLVYRGQDTRTIMNDPWSAVHPDDRLAYEDLWRRCLSNGQQFSHKVRLRRFDNNWRWFYTRATPLRDKKQKIVHWAGTNMDIHDQQLAETNAARQQETAASEAKYRALANSSPQIVFAVTRARGVTFCNSQWVIYSGQTEEQARGMGFMDYVHPDDLAKCRLPTFNNDGTLSSSVPTTVPAEVRRLDSSRSSSDDSSDTGRTITSPGGKNSPATVVMPQAKLSKLADVGILKVSRDPDGRPSYSTEVRLRAKEGDFRWHLVRVLQSDPVHKDDEEEETWYGTCTDINDHKVLEQNLKDTMDAKSRFLSNMSHEIRTPLNGITGMVNFLIDSNLTSEQMEHVNIIRNSTEGLRDLINDILDLSKVEAGMITLQSEWMQVQSLIEEVNDLTSAMAIDKGLELNYTVESNVPNTLRGDRFRIRQVLLNVVGNAIKFTQEGEVFVRCSVDPNKDQDEEEPIRLSEFETLLRFEVMDTGAGFTEEEARFLFKRFSQIDSSTTKQHTGTGLGLAISMQLVELHGGRMKASSRPGEGSIFTFTVKFALPSPNDRPESALNTPGIRSRINTPAIAPPRPIGTPRGFVSSPSPLGAASPALSNPASSAGSDPSFRTVATSIDSGLSSKSSFSSDFSIPPAAPMALAMPTQPRGRSVDHTNAPGDSDKSTNTSSDTVRPGSQAYIHRNMTPLSPPPMFSVLLVCPMMHAREAITKHISMTIPKTSPYHITAKASLTECAAMFGGTDPVIFTHVVLNLKTVAEIVGFLDRVFASHSHAQTSTIIITDLAQKRELASVAPRYDPDKLRAGEQRRIRCVFKPSKPSKFAAIFDPANEGDLSFGGTGGDNAQSAAVSQKIVFEDLKARVGGRGKNVRVLLVEDNKTNQMVLQKFLKKVDILCDCVQDGQECTDRVFSRGYGAYSIILCDLHMPNKDGYQTCKEIRRWERHQQQPHMPIIALSANVLGDVYAKCVDAGFNSYVTKPVDFKELADVLGTFLEMSGTGKEVPFMVHKGKRK